MLAWLRRLFKGPSPSGRRLKLGELAIEKGWVTESDILECLEIQYEESKKNPGHNFRRIGEILVATGKLTQEQLDELLRIQSGS